MIKNIYFGSFDYLLCLFGLLCLTHVDSSDVFLVYWFFYNKVYIIYSQWLWFLSLSGSGKLRPSRVQSVVSSQGSMDSDMLGEASYNTKHAKAPIYPHGPSAVCGSGYDGGSSDSECDGPTMNEQERQMPLMPDFWLIIRIHQDRVEVFSHARCCCRDALGL